MNENLEVKNEPTSPGTAERKGLTHTGLGVKTEYVSPATEKEIFEMKEELRKMREAHNRNTEEIQYLRNLLKSASEQHEYKQITDSKIRILQTQMDQAMMVIRGLGGFAAQNIEDNFQFELPDDLQEPPLSTSSERIKDFEAVTSDSRFPMDPNQKMDSSPMLRAPMNQEPSPFLAQLQSHKVPRFSTIYCIFCEIDTHYSLACTVYRYPAERKAVARNKNLCLKCWRPLDDTSLDYHAQCPMPLKPCRKCPDASHHLLFCDKAWTLLTKKICDFCDRRSHYSMQCGEYFKRTTASQRKQKMRSENRCFLCFKDNRKKTGKHRICPNNGHVCQLCVHLKFEKEPHHPLLCEYFYDNQQERVPKEVPSSRPAPY